MRAFRVRVPSEHEETATGVLWELGTAGVEIRDDTEENRILVAYFADDAGADRHCLRAALPGLPGVEVTEVPVPDVDWVARQRRGFRPLQVGRFRIAPSWDRRPEAPDVLIVEPGRAFGTGAHETTRLCLSLLQELAGKRPLGAVADVGAGTALLALAALRLGARVAVAVDLDPDAIESARVHARLNGAGVAIVRGDGGRPLRPRSFDVVVANLTVPLLIERRAELAGLRAPEGALLLSGMLREDLPEVEDAYRPFGPWDEQTEGGWAAAVVGWGGT
jgi:ribosomal protein L11 methyltransferase